LYEIAYTLAVQGSDVEKQQALLTELFNDTSAIDSTLQAVVEKMGLPNVTTLFATVPDVLVWFETTATHTSTTKTSTTCCVCDLPSADVPLGLAGPDFQSTSGLPDLIRIECTGTSVRHV
jgi:hypothetical protein